MRYPPVARATPALFPPEDRDRVAEAWARRQLLESTWRPLLAEHGERQLGKLRARLVGEWDVSANLFASVVDQTCTMYDEIPTLAGDAVLVEALRRYWPIAREHQKYVRGLGENLVYVGWDPETKRTTFELVAPNEVTIDASTYDRSRPVTIWRARLRPWRSSEGAAPEATVFWDRWSIAGGVGSFEIWSNDRKRNMTAVFVDPAEHNGERYPCVDEEGLPLLPFALYHAHGAGRGLWNGSARAEVVFGTLQVGLLWTAAIHGVLRASWDQRVLLNGKIRGGASESVGGSQIRTLTPDPTGVLQVDGEGASIGAWGASIDIDAAERFCRLYEGRLAVHFGLSPADLVIESLNAASGASITVSQAGKRTIAKRDRVNFAGPDLELAEIVAARHRGEGIACSARGLGISYPGVALTISERVQVGQYVAVELERGLLDRVTAYQELHPGTTEAEAVAAIAALDKRAEEEQRRREVLEALAEPAAEEPTDDESEAAEGDDEDLPPEPGDEVDAGDP